MLPGAYTGEVGYPHSKIKGKKLAPGSGQRTLILHHEVPLARAVRLDRPTMMSLASITHTPTPHIGWWASRQIRMRSQKDQPSTTPAAQPACEVSKSHSLPGNDHFIHTQWRPPQLHRRQILASVPHTGPCLSVQAHRQEIISWEDKERHLSSAFGPPTTGIKAGKGVLPLGGRA